MSINQIKTSDHPIISMINTHLDTLTAIKRTCFKILPLQVLMYSKLQEETKEYLQINTREFTDSENEYSFKLNPDTLAGVLQKLTLLDQERIGQDQIARSMFLALLSEFDAFCAELIRMAILCKPEKMRAIKTQTNLSEISKYSDIEHLKTYLLDSFIESKFYGSKLEQFRWIESFLNIEIVDKISNLPGCMEMFIRRNLAAHASCKVNDKYLSQCNDIGYNTDGIRKGMVLLVDPEYFETSFHNIFFLSYIMFVHISEKYFDLSQEDTATYHINSGYELIYKNEFSMAVEVISYALKNCDVLLPIDKRKLILNLAQSHKWLKNDEKCNKVLDLEDWQDANDQLMICVSVLRDDFEDAVLRMKRIGGRDEYMKRDAYENWPIFREFRKTEEFTKAYGEIFGTEHISKTQDMTGAATFWNTVESIEEEKREENSSGVSKMGSKKTGQKKRKRRR